MDIIALSKETYKDICKYVGIMAYGGAEDKFSFNVRINLTLG